jgi:3-keto-disaccharide hydrolase
MRWMGLALLLAAAGCSEPDSGSMPAETAATGAPSAGGWMTLFDGRNLDAFDRVGDANWRIDGDAVVADDGSGMLVTRESYADFDLEAEFWVDVPANSGIFLRCQDSQNVTATTCYEVNIFDTRPDQTYRTGAIVDVASPNRTMNAAGRWNRFRISAHGAHLEVELNGESMVDVEDDRLSEGPIGLQRGAGVVMFRNVRIRPDA